ncbi:hypothetical protein Tco_1074584, partial [Tanacetum coccineum]
MTWFEQLEIHLRDLYLNNSSYAVDAFKPAFPTFFDEEHQAFRLKMFHNLDQLRLQLERENLHEVNAKTCLEVIRTQFKEFFASKGVNSSDHLNQCWQQDFKEYTLCELDTYKRDLLKNLDTLEAVIHRVLQSQDVRINLVQAVNDSLIVSKSSWIESKNNNESLVTESTTLEANLNTDVKAWDAGSVITESSGTKLDKHDTSSSSGKYITHAVDADIRPVNDQVPFAEFASQVDEKNILSKPVSPHYFPNIRESAPTKSHHVNAPSSARNSQKDSYGSNDMAHNYFLEEAMKKTQDRNRNLKPREMPSARTHHTPNACTPRPRSNNKTFRNWSASKSSNVKLNIVQKAYHSRNSSSFLDSKHFVCSTCQKCVFNENHDACVTKLLNEVNSRARKPSHKSTTRYKPIEKISNTKKSLRWKPEGRVFKTVGLKWIPTGKIFTSSTTKVGSEPPNGLNEDITNLYECEKLILSVQ